VEIFLGGLLIVTLIFFVIRWYFGTSRQYCNEVEKALKEVEVVNQLITEEDLKVMPELVMNYLIKVGVIGKPRVEYFKVEMTGAIKLEKEMPFGDIVVEQYSFLSTGKRIFKILMKYKGIPVNGLHYYHADDAMMIGKILDSVKVLDASGEVMHKAETVTYFNDLCIMAPAGLLEEEIEWESLDDRKVRGTLSKHGYKVSAVLTFNNEGMLVDFISEDRLAANKDGSYDSIPWSTPMHGFAQVGDYYLPNEGVAVWHYPNNDYEYIQLKINHVSIN